MTFDNGQTTGGGNVTEQFVRLIVQAIITLAVIGGWFYMLSVQSPMSAEIQPLVISVIGFWFAQGVVGVFAGYKRDQSIAAIEQARAAQMMAHAQGIDESQPSLAARAARRFTGADR